MYTHKNGITLRKAEREDIPQMHALKSESWFGTHNIAIINRLDQQRWFESLSNDKQLIMVAEKDNRAIGLYKISNIDWMNRRYDSAHDIYKEYRGKGLSTPVLEAGVDFGFEVLNMFRIDTEVLENNIASYKSAIKVGFIKEGVKRKCIHKCGEYLDSIFLGILRYEWVELERVKKYNYICNVSYTPKDGK